MQSTSSPSKASRRRAQNAAAQRSYRAKQKQKMQRLEAMTIAALTSSDPAFAGDVLALRRPCPGQGGSQRPPVPAEQTLRGPSPTNPPQVRVVTRHEPDDGVVSFSRVHALLASCTPRERMTFNIVVAREKFALRDVVKYGLIRLGYAMNPSLFEGAMHASPRAWIRQVVAAIGDVDILAVIAAGIRLLAGFPLPPALLEDGHGEVMRRIALPQQSGTLTNRLTLATVSLGAACFANAELLGIPPSAMMEDENIPMPPRTLQCTKPDLVPTAAQVAVPHHPSIDVIPWPVFRANVCAALAHDPPLVNDDELCLDMMNDGVRCWGSTGGDSMNGRGHGAPWDSRSWEAAPWFLEKWEMFTGGRDGDMWRSSEWWQYMRN